MIPQLTRCLAMAVLIATSASAVPTPEPTDSPGDRAPARGPTVSTPRPNRPAPALRNRIPTSQERDDAFAFAREHMPNLYHMYETADRGPRRLRLGGQMIRAYRRYQQARE